MNYKILAIGTVFAVGAASFSLGAFSADSQEKVKEVSIPEACSEVIGYGGRDNTLLCTTEGGDYLKYDILYNKLEEVIAASELPKECMEVVGYGGRKNEWICKTEKGYSIVSENWQGERFVVTERIK